MNTLRHIPESSSGAIAQTRDHCRHPDALTEQSPDTQTPFDHDLSPPTEPDHPLFLHPIQAQGLVINSHRYEDEADMMARQVMTDIHHSHLWSVLNPFPRSVPPTPNPQYSQVSPSHLLGTSNPHPIDQQFNLGNHDTHQRLAKSGHPLPQYFRRDMERYFQSDLSGIRIHTDIKANQLNREMQSYAIAHGQDILFRDGAYQPHQPHGQAVLIHELTHVMQQQSLRKQGLPLPIQCIKLKGRNALEIETDDIKRDNLDHLPDSIRLHMAHVIEILENAGNGRLWNEETQAFQQVEDSPVSGPQAKKLRKRLRDQAQFLDTYRQENEPRSKKSVPEGETSTHAEQFMEGHLTPHELGAYTFDPDDPELDFLRDFETFKAQTIIAQEQTDMMIAAFQGQLHLSEKEVKKKIKNISSNPISASLIAPLSLPPIQHLEDTLMALNKLRDQISHRIWSFSPETLFLKMVGGKVHILQDFEAIQGFLEKIPQPGILIRHYRWIGDLYQDLRLTYDKIIWNQKAKDATKLLEVSYQKKALFQRLTTQKIEVDKIHVHAGQEMVEQYGTELKATRKSKKKRATVQTVDRELKNLVLDDSRKTAHEIELFTSVREHYERAMQKDSEQLIKAKQVISATQQAEGEYVALLEQARQHLRADPLTREIATFEEWQPVFAQEQDLLKHLHIYQSFEFSLEQNLTERLQSRRDWHSPTVGPLMKLKANFEKPAHSYTKIRSILKKLLAAWKTFKIASSKKMWSLKNSYKLGNDWIAQSFKMKKQKLLKSKNGFESIPCLI